MARFGRPVNVLGLTLDALAELDVTVMVATAGRIDLGGVPDNIQAADQVWRRMALSSS
jgi:UDP:flavonoid glycosyltransferase YjiC (YdhE family)